MPVNKTVSLALAILILILIRALSIGRRPKNYPPGPPTVPFFGNLLQMPTRDIHKQFERWARQYGPVYSLILGTKTMIVLSGNTAIKDLLDKRSAATNERNRRYIGHEILSNGERILLMPYGAKWRLQRKLFHKMLSVSVSQSYLPYIELENTQMLSDLVTNPGHFFRHIKRYTNSLTMAMTYGKRSPQYDDPVMLEILEILEKTTNILQSSAANLPDAYPVLQWLPPRLLPGVKTALEHTRTEEEVYLRLWNEVKEAMRHGRQKPCFAADLVHEQEKGDFSDRFCAYIAGGSLEAGTDTTSNTILAFIQAMILFPHVLKEAQVELDRVVGNRLPTLADLPNLPYVRGCVKETLRWSPTTVIAAPHATFADEMYMGYILPKGAELINNVWTINNDPKIFDDPRQFNPARYLKDSQSSFEAAQNADVSKRDHFTFGTGRRLCAGIHLADITLFLGISRIIWGFDIKPDVDKDTRKEIIPDPERRTQGLVSMPERFPANFSPRSLERAEMMKQSWTEARLLLDDQMQWKETPEGMKFAVD